MWLMNKDFSVVVISFYFKMLLIPNKIKRIMQEDWGGTITGNVY